MADLKFYCPECRQKIGVDFAEVGRTMECPVCASSLVIPTDSVGPVKVLISRRRPGEGAVKSAMITLPPAPSVPSAVPIARAHAKPPMGILDAPGTHSVPRATGAPKVKAAPSVTGTPRAVAGPMVVPTVNAVLAAAPASTAEEEMRIELNAIREENLRITQEQAALKLELEAARQRESELERNHREESAHVRNLTKRGEEHRKLAIDLAAQLDASRREMMEMTANLAEARLQAKFANAKTAASTSGSTNPSAAPENTINTKNQEPLTEKDARNLLNAMGACLEALIQNPSEINLVDDLYGHARNFSERARISGMVALYRLSFAFASLARYLFETPDSLNPSTVSTMQQTVEFLLTLVRERNLIALKDPSKAQVYAVDHDPENCEFMAMGLDMIMLSTAYSTESTAALSDLASGSFDLIFLAVDLPGMDGFELCTEIRKMPNYTKTPIVFVTGMDTPEHRTRSTLSGGNDFITKPFNLHEFNVKALVHILNAQLSA